MEPANSDGEGKGDGSNCPAEPVLETSSKDAPWMMNLAIGDDLACEEPPSSFHKIPTVSKARKGPPTNTAIEQLPVNRGGTIASNAAYTPGKLEPAPKQSALKQSKKPAVTGIARQDTFVLDKPTLSVHVPKLMPTAGSTATEPAGTDSKSNTPASKIPLPKTEKLNTPSRIPLPKRSLTGKQPPKFGASKPSPVGGGVQKKEK